MEVEVPDIWRAWTEVESLTFSGHGRMWSHHQRLPRAPPPLSHLPFCLQVHMVTTGLTIILDKGHAMGWWIDEPEEASVPGDFVVVPYQTVHLWASLTCGGRHYCI